MRTAMLTLAAFGLIGLAGAADQLGEQQDDAIAREIVGDQIAKQADFSKEYLLYFRWNGVADDELSFALKAPFVVITFKPGEAKNKEIHAHLYALPKNTKWALEETKKSIRAPRVTKISNAEELMATFPDSR